MAMSGRHWQPVYFWRRIRTKASNRIVPASPALYTLISGDRSSIPEAVDDKNINRAANLHR